MNLKKGVGIDHCYKKQGNKVGNMHLCQHWPIYLANG